MSADTMTAEEALKQITTGDLGTGGTLPREMFDEFFEEVQKQSRLLDRVRSVPMDRSEMRIPKIGVGERLRSGQAENTTQSESGINTDYIDLDAEKGSIYWSLTRETVEENPEREQLADTVLGQMSRQWSVDTEDLGVNGDEAGTGFVTQNDGWLTLANARAMPTYSHVDGSGNSLPVRSDLFHEAIQTLESQYKRADPVFVMNDDQVQDYQFHLTERESGLGDSVLFGDQDLTPFNYDVIGVPMMPPGQALFTPARNLIYGLRYDDMRIEVLRESDEVFDNDLHAKYKIVGKDDFQIEDENAGVLITDIAAP